MFKVGDKVRVLEGATMDKDDGWVDPKYFGEICVVEQCPRENVPGRYLVVAGSEVDENGFGQFIHEDWLEKVEVFEVKVGQKYNDVDRLVRASVWLGLDWSREDIERVVGLAGDLK